MKYERRKVKATTKSYKSRTTNKVKESLIKSIYLGTDSIFDVKEEVVLLSTSDFDEILEFEEKDSEDKQIIEELRNELQILKNDKESLLVTIKEKEDEIENLLEIKNNFSITKEKLQSENHNLFSELNQTKNMIMLLQQKEKNLEKIILKYESYNLLDRILKKNPKDELNISEDNLIGLIEKEETSDESKSD